MRKEYFAKYLHVKGEESGLPSHEIAYYGMPFRNTREALGDFIEERDGWAMYQTLKLFLCSRDIQVGDAIIADYVIDGSAEEIGIHHVKKEGTVTKEEYGDHWEIVTSSGREYARKDGCFKVIGEILTPNIKDGQEFTEEEVEYLTIKS